ncbi:MAG TPA: hypothetical protein VIG80_08300 [Bacillaceae bacterium]
MAIIPEGMFEMADSLGQAVYLLIGFSQLEDEVSNETLQRISFPVGFQLFTS